MKEHTSKSRVVAEVRVGYLNCCKNHHDPACNFFISVVIKFCIMDIHIRFEDEDGTSLACCVIVYTRINYRNPSLESRTRIRDPFSSE
jgi:hypothetical protein